MRIVIDISEDYMPWIENNLGYIPDKISKEIGTRILNGTVLPKDHGRLIDADKLYKEQRIDLSDVAPTIIVADTGVEK